MRDAAMWGFYALGGLVLLYFVARVVTAGILRTLGIWLREEGSTCRRENDDE